jgi:hypothetical protein
MPELLEDFSRIGLIDHADAFIACGQPRLQERDHHLVALGLACIEAADVIAHLGLEAVHSQRDTRRHRPPINEIWSA